ncbi:MAG: PrgI family protein, partial [Patescibacteria group bacterium]|nr:PrgI family protein [Patescibacteria group bacterium]
MDIIEGHPIPQDITGFQFRIIGDLTIKQFGYLAVGLVLGWVFFSIPMPIIIKVPLAVLVAGTGIIFAFVPIQGRPADTMLLLFIRAVLNANEYTYKKQQAETPASSQATTPTAHPDHASTPTPAADTLLHQPAPEVTNTATVSPNNTPTDPPASTDAHAKALDLAKQLEDTRLEKQKLEEQLLSLQQQLQQKPQQVFSPTA